MTFNGKAKSTSQFFYNLSQDKPQEIIDKLEKTIADYFSYYSNFQNKTPIQTIEAFSIDFKCENKCVINVSHKVNVIGLVFTQEELVKTIQKMATKYSIPIDAKLQG